MYIHLTYNEISLLGLGPRSIIFLAFVDPMTYLLLKLSKGHNEIKVTSKLKAWHSKIWWPELQRSKCGFALVDPMTYLSCKLGHYQQESFSQLLGSANAKFA